MPLSLFALRSAGQSDRWLRIATGFAALFGMVFLLNIHPIGDGLWYWYAQALRHGQRLYGDLHVPMQPFFFLTTEFGQRLFGNSWLASKIFAAVQVFAYCFGLLLVVRRVSWSDRARALLLIAVFGMTIMAFYSRFDDFHVTGHCLVVYSVYFLLRLRDTGTRKHTLQLALVLGLLSGLGLGNRLNDGSLLCAAVAVCIAVFARQAGILAPVSFLATALLTLAALVAATHAGLHDWLQYTIIRAAAIKGGTAHIFSSPLHFPITVQLDLETDPHLLRDFGYALVLVGSLAYARYFRQLRRPRYTRRITIAAGLLAVPLSLALLQQSLSGGSVLSVAQACTIALYVLFVGLLLRLLHLHLTGRLAEWNRLEVLLLLPFGQIFAGAMTSGESFDEAYSPLAFFLLVLPFVLPSLLRVPWQRIAFAGVLAILACGSLLAKATHPYFWLHYNDRAFFVDRTWYNHPTFGPMYVERPQLALMQSMCRAIRPSTNPPQLLAMPWPYPNYFCNIPPWHGYVQTWYDTTTRQTIEHLIEELRQNPPEWIAYQRSFDTIRANEIIFNGGRDLPHRELDAFIQTQLEAGRWTLPWQRCFGGTDWVVIHTRTPRPGEPNDNLLPSTDTVNLCARTNDVYRF